MRAPIPDLRGKLSTHQNNVLAGSFEADRSLVIGPGVWARPSCSSPGRRRSSGPGRPVTAGGSCSSPLPRSPRQPQGPAARDLPSGGQPRAGRHFRRARTRDGLHLPPTWHQLGESSRAARDPHALPRQGSHGGLPRLRHPRQPDGAHRPPGGPDRTGGTARPRAAGGGRRGDREHREEVGTPRACPAVDDPEDPRRGA